MGPQFASGELLLQSLLLGALRVGTSGIGSPPRRARGAEGLADLKALVEIVFGRRDATSSHRRSRCRIGQFVGAAMQFLCSSDTR